MGKGSRRRKNLEMSVKGRKESKSVLERNLEISKGLFKRDFLRSFQNQLVFPINLGN